jgi:hypothetical protein
MFILEEVGFGLAATVQPSWGLGLKALSQSYWESVSRCGLEDDSEASMGKGGKRFRVSLKQGEVSNRG